MWVALIPARSILYNVKKQLWCLIFSTRLHALRVRSFSFWSLFVFLCRSGSQRHCCCTTRGASSMTSSTSQSKEEAHGALGPPRCREKNDDVIIKQSWRKHGRATFTSYRNYLGFHGKTRVRFCRRRQNFQILKKRIIAVIPTRCEYSSSHLKAVEVCSLCSVYKKIQLIKKK